MDTTTRIFPIADFIRPSDGEPFRSVVLQTEEAAIVVWACRFPLLLTQNSHADPLALSV